MEKRIWKCATCGMTFDSERGIISHLVKKSEILIAYQRDIKRKQELRKKILREMVESDEDYYCRKRVKGEFSA